MCRCSLVRFGADILFAVLCCVVLCGAVWCCVVLCGAVLCSVVFCCVLLCSVLAAMCSSCASFLPLPPLPPSSLLLPCFVRTDAFMLSFSLRFSDTYLRLCDLSVVCGVHWCVVCGVCFLPSFSSPLHPAMAMLSERCECIHVHT